MIWSFAKVKQRNPDSFFSCTFSFQIPTLAAVKAKQTLKFDPVQSYLGAIPYRLQLAGGWIDQPFVSRHNPKPLGSMVVVQIEPNFRPMDRSGIAGGTRAIAMKLWRGRLPKRPGT